MHCPRHVWAWVSATGNGAVNGPIDPDGRFTLGTIVGNERVSGVPEGEYEATVIPPMGEDQRSDPPRGHQSFPRTLPSAGVITLRSVCSLMVFLTKRTEPSARTTEKPP